MINKPETSQTGCSGAASVRDTETVLTAAGVTDTGDTWAIGETTGCAIDCFTIHRDIFLLTQHKHAESHTFDNRRASQTSDCRTVPNMRFYLFLILAPISRGDARQPAIRDRYVTIDLKISIKCKINICYSILHRTDNLNSVSRY